MPSDARVREALHALEAGRAAYRSRVGRTADEVRAWLAARADTVEERAEMLARELGPFARGRIDARRLAALVRPPAARDEETRAVVEDALRVLDELASAPDEAFVLSVPEGGDLTGVVQGALSRLGRAFGASRAVDLARGGARADDERARPLDAYPFRRWSVAERAMAPPLVVQVRGEDLRPAGLAELLQGATRIAVVVEGDAPPAAMARLVSPGVWVGQSPSLDALAALAATEGPGALALFDAEAAPFVVPFVHDPRGGQHAWERITLTGEPEAIREKVRGGPRRWRTEGFLDELAHLLSLGEAPAPPPAAAREGASPDEVEPADRLAAWLLAATDLGER